MPVAIQRDALEKVAVVVLRSRAPVRVAKSLVPLPDFASDGQVAVTFRIERYKLHWIPEVLAAGGISEIPVIFVLTRQRIRGRLETPLWRLSPCERNEPDHKNQRNEQAGSHSEIFTLL